MEGVEEAQERGSQTGCLGHGRSCCRRPRPGSLNLRWTELHSPVMKDKSTDLITMNTLNNSFNGSTKEDLRRLLGWLER